METFPLLRLPYVVRKMVHNKMEFIDLFDLARLSKRMREIVKRDFQTRGLTLQIIMGDFVSFALIGKDRDPSSAITLNSMNAMRNDFHLVSRKFGRFNEVPSMFAGIVGDHLISTFWMDLIVGAEEVHNEILDLFPLPISEVTFDFYQIGENYSRFVTWLNALGPNIPTITVIGEHVHFNVYIWTLQNIRSVGEVRYFAQPAQYLDHGELRLGVERLHIEYGQWVKMVHLLSMRPSQLLINNTTIEEISINDFLVELKAGSNPNLTELVLIYTRAVDTITMFEELEVIDVEPDMWMFELDNGDICTVRYSLSVVVDEELYEIEIRVNRNGGGQ
ncbi:unnamed protein product [Caenorhabditis brenneri]